MKKYFRKPIPNELVLKAVRSLGLQNMTDTNWIEESYLIPELMMEVIEEVRPFYFPCWAETYLDKDEFSYSDYLCIVRQLLRTKDTTFVRREKAERVQKNVVKYVPYYKLKPPSQTAHFEVEFA